MRLLFQEKTLYATSLEDFKEYCQTFNINDSEQRLALFEEFNQGSVKTKVSFFSYVTDFKVAEWRSG